MIKRITGSIWLKKNRTIFRIPVVHSPWEKNFNTLRLRQNGHRFDTFKQILSNKNVVISIKISLKFVPKGPINNNPALVQIMKKKKKNHSPNVHLVTSHILAFITKPSNTSAALQMRLKFERDWIYRLRTNLPHGLNAMDWRCHC